MTELTLELDQKAMLSMEGLMKHYGVVTKAELISKALAMLRIAAEVDRTDGILVARKGNRETQLVFRSK
jgi:hypothetical protein